MSTCPQKYINNVDFIDFICIYTIVSLICGLWTIIPEAFEVAYWTISDLHKSSKKYDNK